MNASSTSLASGFGRAKIFALAALVVAAGVFAFAGAAKAETSQIVVDNGKLNLGVLFTNKTIIPAEVPGPLDPVMPNTSPNGTIDVDVNGTAATVGAGDFKMPIFGVPNPTNPSQTVPIQTAVPAGLEGTFDAATGKLELSGALAINVITGANGSGAEVCSIQVPSVTFSTEPNTVTPGRAFTSGLTGDGAIAATWEDLPNGVEVNGGDCSTVNSIIHDVGSIWFSHGIANPDPVPTCAEDETGTWPNCVKKTPCPEGTTGDYEPNCTPIADPAKITKVAIAPKKKTVKAGKKLKLTVKVTNKGGTAKTVTVKLKSSNKKVKVAKKVKIKVGAGKTVGKKVTVNVTKKAKGKAKITAKAEGKTGKSTLTVKKAKKKRK